VYGRGVDLFLDLGEAIWLSEIEKLNQKQIVWTLSPEEIGSNSSSDNRCHAEARIYWHAAKDRTRKPLRTILLLHNAGQMGTSGMSGYSLQLCISPLLICKALLRTELQFELGSECYIQNAQFTQDVLSALCSDFFLNTFPF
jgi:hypothetical protein